MKIWLISITLLSLTLISLTSSGWWVLYTTAGSHWTVKKIISLQQGHIGEIQGTIAGDLYLTDMQLGPKGEEIRCANLKLTTHQLQIFPLHLQIETLRLNNLQVERKASVETQQSLRLSLPELPWWMALIQVDLQNLKLVDFQLHQSGNDPFRIKQLQGQIHWHEQNLLISDLLLQLSELLTIQGQVQFNLATPTLFSELEILQHHHESSWHKILVRTDLQAAKNLLLAGPIHLTLSGDNSPFLEVRGQFGVGTDALEVSKLRLERPEHPGSLMASGRLNFSHQPLGITSHIQLMELDLQSETGQNIKLSGEVELSGNLNDYRGRFTLKNLAEPPLDISLSGNYSGNRNQVHLNELQGDILNGTIGGQALINWINGWQIDAQVYGRKLDPQQLHEQFIGEINLDLQVQLSKHNENLDGNLSLIINDSSLHNQPLHGTAEILVTNQQFEIAQLHLQGDGITLLGNGKLNDKIHLSFTVDRLEQLFNESRGQVTAEGWFKLLPEGMSADFRAQTEHLAFQKWLLEKGTLRAQNTLDPQHWKLQFSGKQLSGAYPQLDLESIHVQLEGALEEHKLLLKLKQVDANLQAELVGGWNASSWQGSLLSFTGEDRLLGFWQTRKAVPLVLSAERLQLENLELVSADHGKVSLQGYFLPPNQNAEAHLQWQQLDLELLQPWLKGWDIAARSRGYLSITLGEKQQIHGSLSLLGYLKKDNLSFNFKQAQWLLEWNEQGLQSDLNLQLEDGSQLQGQISSPDKMAYGWPHRGKIHFTGMDVPLTRAQPWLPLGLNVTGILNGQTQGQWQTEKPWTVTGSAKVTDGRFYRQEEDNLISAQLNDATLHWDWSEQLDGSVQLQFLKHGNIDAQLTLPMTANWPVQLNKSGLLSGELHAKLQDLGLLSILLPGRVQESRGQIETDLQLSGNWEQPILRGSTRLSKAGAYLPTLGIELKNVDLFSSMNADQIKIESLNLTSADGVLRGQGYLTLSNWQPQDYQLQLKGEKFQLVNLPEMTIQITPDLNVTGNMNGYSLRGTVSIPELHINNQKRANLPKNSPDLVVIDASDPPEKRYKLTHDIDLQLLLGDQVLVDSAGMDAKLNGSLRLRSTVQQELAAFGEIHVVKGKYSSYGVSLNITRGNLFFNGGAIDQPSLDILALRQSGEVEAGVKVTGTPKEPVVQLYSEPTMAETDILSYIVLGRPVGESGSQSSLLMTAAGALLSQGESAVLQEKLKKTLGLDVLDISAGDGDVSSSIITTGKYLSPDLYVSLGYSLFSNSNEIKIRYKLTPDWEIESNIGDESGSGIDLFYKLESQE